MFEFLVTRLRFGGLIVDQVVHHVRKFFCAEGSHRCGQMQAGLRGKPLQSGTWFDINVLVLDIDNDPNKDILFNRQFAVRCIFYNSTKF